MRRDSDTNGPTEEIVTTAPASPAASDKPGPSMKEREAAAESAAGDWKSMGASDSTLVLGPPKLDGPSQEEIESQHWTIKPSVRNLTVATPSLELGIEKEVLTPDGRLGGKNWPRRDFLASDGKTYQIPASVPAGVPDETAA